MDKPESYGTLYVVATPIGNLEDMTFRAVTVLKQVDLIAAEDTRHSKILLNHYGIATKLISCHEHNEADKTPLLISHLKTGLSIALISDAGTPTISDPGYHLVKTAAKANIPVIPIPGCSSTMAGLSVSGLPTDAFHFSGFLPKKVRKLEQVLDSLRNQRSTLIFYESPRRIKNLISAMIRIFGDRQACLAREITKLHEEYLRGPLSEIRDILDQRETVKGECVLFVQGYESKEMEVDEEEIEKFILDRIDSADLGTSELSRQIAKKTGLPKTRTYEMILRLRRTNPGR